MERFVFAAAVLLVALAGFAAATGHAALWGGPDSLPPPDALVVFTR